MSKYSMTDQEHKIQRLVFMEALTLANTSRETAIKVLADMLERNRFRASMGVVAEIVSDTIDAARHLADGRFAPRPIDESLDDRIEFIIDHYAKAGSPDYALVRAAYCLADLVIDETAEPQLGGMWFERRVVEVLDYLASAWAAYYHDRTAQGYQGKTVKMFQQTWTRIQSDRKAEVMGV